MVTCGHKDGLFSCPVAGFSSSQILQEIQNDLRKRNIEPEKVHRWDHLHVNVQRHRLDKDSDAICISNSEKVKEYAKGFSQGHWSFLCPGDEKKWYTLGGT